MIVSFLAVSGGMEVLKWTFRSFSPVLATHIFKSGFAQRSMNIWSSIYKQ
jgi:hypothetical protein